MMNMFLKIVMGLFCSIITFNCFSGSLLVFNNTSFDMELAVAIAKKPIPPIIIPGVSSQLVGFKTLAQLWGRLEHQLEKLEKSKGLTESIDLWVERSKKDLKEDAAKVFENFLEIKLVPGDIKKLGEINKIAALAAEGQTTSAVVPALLAGVLGQPAIGEKSLDVALEEIHKQNGVNPKIVMTLIFNYYPSLHRIKAEARESTVAEKRKAGLIR